MTAPIHQFSRIFSIIVSSSGVISPKTSSPTQPPSQGIIKNGVRFRQENVIEHWLSDDKVEFVSVDD